MKKRTFTTTIVCLLLAAMLCLSAACGNTPTKNKKTHDQETYVVTGSNPAKICVHNFVNGKCTMCAEETIFRQEAMASSPDILTTAQDASKQGTISEFWYKTRAYGVESKLPDQGEMHIVKRAFVYTPVGYDAKDTSKKYNVLFMMHGNKLNEGYWFRQGTYADPSAWSAYTGGYGTENMLDYMFANGMCQDTIIVTPTLYSYYYNEKQGDVLGGDAEVGNLYCGYIDPDYAGIDTATPTKTESDDAQWWKEFQYDLLPYVVNNYNTYANSSSEADMIAARDHVGFTGLSRGTWITNVVIENCFPFISYYAYESGAVPSDKFIEKYNSEWKDKYPINYFFISSGSSENPESTAEGMLKVKAALGLKEGSDIKGGDKIVYIVVNGTAHNYATWITNLWNLMLVFFK